MRILTEECKKILNLRLLLLLTLFAVLFYNMFSELSLYPAGGQCTDSPYDMPYAATLIQKFGPTLPVNEKWKIVKEQKSLVEKATQIIRKDQALKKTGVTDYEHMKKEYDRLSDLEDNDKQMTKKEQKEYQAIIEFLTFPGSGEKIYFQIQYTDELLNDFNHAERKEVNMLRSGAVYILQSDMGQMPILILISYAVLLIAYHVRERLCGVLPLYGTTRTGRKIYRMQYQAGMLCCLLLGTLQLAIYTAVWMIKGMGIFWQCPAWENSGADCWLNGLTLGQYMAVYEILVLIFCLSVMALIYLAARTAPGYISGVVFEIAVCALGGIAGYLLFSGLCSSTSIIAVKMWELPTILSCVIVAVGIIYFRLKRDKTRDVV